MRTPRPSGVQFRPTGRNEGQRKPDTCNHLLQLFDTSESLAEEVSAFLTVPEAAGQRLLVVATAKHWELIAAGLRLRGFNPDDEIAAGRLVVEDAHGLLAQLMRRGKPMRALFDQTIRAVVARLATTSPGGLRIYGEMVEVLARDRNCEAAEALEKLWNELGRDYPFTLLCGYAAAHFASPDAGSALAAIRDQHSHAISVARDPLSHFLLSGGRIQAAADRAAGQR
jgi:hypothetical protein